MTNPAEQDPETIFEGLAREHHAMLHMALETQLIGLMVQELTTANRENRPPKAVESSRCRVCDGYFSRNKDSRIAEWHQGPATLPN